MTTLVPTSRVPRIRVLPGGHLVIALTILLGIAAAHSGQNLLQALVALLLAFQVVSGFRSYLGLRRLEVAVRMPDRMDALQPAAIDVKVRNGKRRLAALSLEIDVVVQHEDEGGQRLEVASGWVDLLAAGSTVRVSLPMTARRRGVARIVEVKVSSAYPCDLFRRALRFPWSTEVLVRPARLSMRLPVRAGVREASGSARLSSRGGGEFRGVRPWREGDPTRAIHWKSSARAGSLVVREDETRGGSTWTIVVAPPPDAGEALEEDLAIAASLLREATASGRTVDLRLAGSSSPLEVRTGRSLSAALDLLARFEPTAAATARGPAAGLVILVGDRARAPSGAERVEQGKALVLAVPAPAPSAVPTATNGTKPAVERSEVVA